MSLIFHVDGIPKAQKRHRTYTKDQRGRTLPFARQVDPSADDKANFLLLARRHAPAQPLEGALALVLVFSLPRPQSHFRTGRYAGELKRTAPQFVATRPDLDNLIKFTKDALAGVFYRNDSQIVTLTAEKVYASGRPRTDIKLTSLWK